MDANTLNTSTDISHAPASTNPAPAQAAARDRWERLWAHDNEIQERVAEGGSDNVIVFPLQETLLAVIWDECKAEVAAEITAGRRPVGEGEFQGENPWRWDGTTLSIQSGVPLPPA